MPIQFLVDVFGLSREEAHTKFTETGGDLTRAAKNIHRELIGKERMMSMLTRGHGRPIKRYNSDEQRIGRRRTLTDDPDPEEAISPA